MIRAALPYGMVRVDDWKARFEAIGLSTRAAWRAAASPVMRGALVASRLELLPLAFRARLRHVVDAGANEGQWLSSLLALTAVERVDAFEPNPSAFEALIRRVGRRAGIHLHQAALGDRPEHLMLNVPRNSVFASLLPPAESLRGQYSSDAVDLVARVRVPVLTLDSAIPRAALIDLLKLDVQGFERRVLAGAADILTRTRAVLIEVNFVSHYEGDDTFGSLYHLLTCELGFEYWDLSSPYRGPDHRPL